VTIRHEFNERAINIIVNDPGGGVARDLTRRGLRVQTAAKHLCPVDQGVLRNSITFNLKTDSTLGGSQLAAQVGTNVVYARAVHDGTGIYGPRGAPITPRGSVMVFTPRGAGRVVFAKSVRGQRPVPFLKDALPAARV